MPRNLLIVRHAESESNAAKKASDRGTPHPREKDLVGVHTSERRLTAKGRDQAKRAGEWIREFAFERAVKHDRKQFAQSRCITSPYVRAMETAELLDLPVTWRPDARISERNWGELDHMTHEERIRRFGEMLEHREEHALFWTPQGGEALQTVMLRIWLHFDMLHRQCSDLDVYEVSHGETMWVYRFLLEYWMPKDLARRMLASDDDFHNKIVNCRIIHYTREYENGDLANRMVRFRLINPEHPDDPKQNLPWQPIAQRHFNNKELHSYVSEFPHFLTDE